VPTVQYGRNLSIKFSTGGGRFLDFKDFRCTFRICRGDHETPNSADIRIYNVSALTAAKIQPEFSTVEIQGGYGDSASGNYGLLFSGTVIQTRNGRIDQRDSYVDITAADGDEAYNYSTLAVSLAAGTTPRDTVQTLLQTMAKHGITAGYVAPSLGEGNHRVRGRVYFGLTRDELRNFCRANNMVWSVQDGKLTMIAGDGYVPGSIPVISPSTGLIGVPEQTEAGINVRVLLNPSIKIGQIIKLDSSNVNQLRYGLDGVNKETTIHNLYTLQKVVNLSRDGHYYVLSINHSGDTRGNEWYSDLTCLATTAKPPVQNKDFLNQSAIPDASVIFFPPSS
jgi:hypothetical protein